MDIDKNNIPGIEETVDRVKHDIYSYGIATFDRQIPSAYDGFKPIARRILYVCWKYKVRSPMKVSKFGGLVAGYHPHGDASITNSVIAMAQKVKMNHPLLEGHGNFGTVGDMSTAAPRYITVNVSDFGYDAIVSLMDVKTMDMIESEADFGEKEPKCLPSKIPMMLVNGSSSITLSFTSNIPQHNLSDVVDATVKFIRNKNISPYELVNSDSYTGKRWYPDYVCGGTIINGDEVPNHYLNKLDGSNVVKVRGDAEIDSINNRIIIRSMPHLFDLDSFTTRVKELMNEKDSNGNPKNLVLTGITGHGEFKKEGCDPYVYLTCKSGTNLVEVLDNLYKNTNLEMSNKINLITSIEGKLKKCNLKDIISDWYEVNYDLRRRKIIYTISDLENKVHILEGVLKIYDHSDEAYAIIKKSTTNKDEIIKKLRDRFGLSLLQARHVYEMQFGSLSRRSKDDLATSVKKMHLEIKSLSDDLMNIDQLMIRDALELKEKYGRPRRTQIMSKLKERKDVIISSGAILATRNSIGVFDADNIISGKKILNGFKGVKINNVWVKEMVNTHKIENNIQSIAVFYESGMANVVYPLNNINCWIPNQSVEENGYIKAVCPIYKGNGTVLCITTDGQLKRFELDALTSRIVNITTPIENCIFIPEGSEDKTVILVNQSGEYLNIKVSEVPTKGRTSQGVLSSFTSGKGVSMALSDGKSSHYVILLENTKLNDGYVLTQQIDELKVMSRTNKLKKLYQFDNFKCLGINIVDLTIKDQLGLFISENSTTSLKVTNLRNLNSPRKINIKAIDFIGIEIS